MPPRYANALRKLVGAWSQGCRMLRAVVGNVFLRPSIRLTWAPLTDFALLAIALRGRRRAVCTWITRASIAASARVKHLRTHESIAHP